MSDAKKKKCSKCGKEYPATTRYFYAHKSTLDGLEGVCKRCRAEQMRTSATCKALKPKPKPGLKTCNKCGRELPADAGHFPTARDSKSGIRAVCKDCYAQAQRDRRSRLRAGCTPSAPAKAGTTATPPTTLADADKPAAMPGRRADLDYIVRIQTLVAEVRKEAHHEGFKEGFAAAVAAMTQAVRYVEVPA